MSLTYFDGHPQVDQDVELLDEVSTDIGYQLIVFNDDVNTFDWVIESLIAICNHTLEQATQSSLFIHYSGKYAVKHGSDDELTPMKDALHDRGINAAVEKCA